MKRFAQPMKRFTDFKNVAVACYAQAPSPPPSAPPDSRRQRGNAAPLARRGASRLCRRPVRRPLPYRPALVCRLGEPSTRRLRYHDLSGNAEQPWRVFARSHVRACVRGVARRSRLSPLRTASTQRSASTSSRPSVPHAVTSASRPNTHR